MRRVFSDHGRLQAILDFEAALARAQARAGILPPAAAQAIAAKCRAELFDLANLARATRDAGNSALPIVNELTRLVAGADPAAAHFVHHGATSQDAMDTGLVLQLRQGLDWIDTDAHKLCLALAKRAEEHKKTPIAARTWLQHATPTTFGLKVAGWLCAMVRHRERLHAARSRELTLQLGGAAGTLAVLGDQAGKVVAFLAEDLRLAPADLPWHAHRDRLVEVAATLGLVAGTLGKMARDVALLTQSEIAEVAEPAAAGRGGSSSMPQKANPVGCATVLAAATRVPALVSTMLSAMPQEHERGLGGWQAEWETLPELFLLTSGALRDAEQIASGLRINALRMRQNLDATHGLIYAESVSAALARGVGHATAHALVERACRRAAEGQHPLFEIVSADPEITAHLPPAELKSLFDPEPYVQAAARLVDQALAIARRESSEPPETTPCPSPK